MIRSGCSDEIVSRFGVARRPTDVGLPISARTFGITRFLSLSSAMPTGWMPIAPRSSTNENSSATTRVGVPCIVTEPIVPLIVRDAVRAFPHVGSNFAPVRSLFALAPPASTVSSKRAATAAVTFLERFMGSPFS